MADGGSVDSYVASLVDSVARARREAADAARRGDAAAERAFLKAVAAIRPLLREAAMQAARARRAGTERSEERPATRRD